MIKAAVLGSPIKHSLSPFIHNLAYEVLGIEGLYQKFEVGVEEFPAFVEEAKSADWTGFSLTMPLKEIAFTQDFDIDARAKKIQSANTLIRYGDSYKVFSTDVLAFDRLLDGISFRNVAVIGAGGTARASLGALDGRAEKISVLLRNDSRQQSLKACLDATPIDFLPMDSPLLDFDLVISTTPSGVSDQLAHNLSSSAHGSEVSGTLIEVLYNPMPTELSDAWNKCGGTIIDGLDLLVEQALDQIHLMSGMSFDYSELRSTLLQGVRAEINR